MFSTLRKLYKELSKQEKINLNFLALIIVTSSLVQVVGIASIFPFIAVVANPASIDGNDFLFWLKQFLGMTNDKEFLIVLGLGALSMLILTNAFMAITAWMTTRFTIKLTHDLSCRMLTCYLNENYLFHLNRNSAQLLKNITSEVHRAINGGVMSAIVIAAKGLSALFILGLIIYIDPVVALVMGLLLAGTYILIYILIKRRLKSDGVALSRSYADRIRYINESIGGIKELTLLGREGLYIKRFRRVSDEQIKYQSFARIAGELPKYLLETVSVGGVLAVTIYLISVKEDISSIIPMISLYAFSGYRLMPALQGVFQGMSSLRADIGSIDSFYDDIQGRPLDDIYLNNTSIQNLPFSDSIAIDNVSFHYPNTSKKAVNSLSINIKAKSSIGIVGTSGSGKSTLIDILLGLIEPQEGEMIIDGQIIDSTMVKSWQRNIGYVPQTIYLADSTISENIAFGLMKNEIDYEAVEKAAKMANLHSFIMAELENGYETLVGEHGIRLSGGQRQRIGIARALYHNPDVLILDEATSALDTPTEQAVMKAVYDLTHQKTIIMIAHRLSTITQCDNIIVMDNGRLYSQGTYSYLMENCDKFKKLANIV